MRRVAAADLLCTSEAMVVGSDERSRAMWMKQALWLGVAAVAIAVIWTGSVVKLSAQQAGGTVQIDGDDIGGGGTGADGPGAGGWGSGGNTDLPTRVARIVGTDEPGREGGRGLSHAQSTGWVRGH